MSHMKTFTQEQSHGLGGPTRQSQGRSVGPTVNWLCDQGQYQYLELTTPDLGLMAQK